LESHCPTHRQPNKISKRKKQSNGESDRKICKKEREGERERVSKKSPEEEEQECDEERGDDSYPIPSLKHT
jgi:hypothetical protein